MKTYTIKLKCGCVYKVYAEDKGHANCQVDYLHYIDVERDKIKICKGKKMKRYTDKYSRIWKLPKKELCKVCGQPGSCGDCNHKKLTDKNIEFLGGELK